MKFFPLIWAGLWRKKARTILTLLSIVVAFILFGLLQGITAGFQDAVSQARMDLLQTRAIASQLPIAFAAQIEAIPGVRRVSYMGVPLGATYRDPKNFVFNLAIPPDPFFDILTDFLVTDAHKDALRKTRMGAIVGADLAKKYDLKIGDQLPFATRTVKQDGGSDWVFEIVGTYQNRDTKYPADQVIINFDYFDEARAQNKGMVLQFQTWIDDPAKATDISLAVDNLFANSPYQTRTASQQEMFKAQMAQIGNFSFIINAVIAAAFFTLLFLTGNTMLQSVRERVPEFAVLKTLGYSDGSITTFVVAETFLMCALGAAIGLAAAVVIFKQAGPVLGGAFSTLSPTVLIAGAAAVIVITLITSVPPVWRVRRIAIVDALAGR